MAPAPVLTEPPAGIAAPPRARRLGALRPRLPSLLTWFRVGSALARILPDPVARAIGVCIGRCLYWRMPQRRAMFARHLRRVRPELGPAEVRAGVRASFDSYARYYVESFRLPWLGREAIERGLAHREGYEHVLAGRDGGRGVIFALPHLGGWEWGGRWMADRGHPMTVVVEPLEPPELFEWFARFRQSLGMTVVPLGPGVVPACLRALKANGVLCLLSDRDLEGGGVEVEFFGERTTLPAGPATLALRIGAVLLPTAVYFRGGGHAAVCLPPIDLRRTGGLREDVARVTQELAYALEEVIRRAPEQWHLFQPNWPSDPGYRR